jgi:hypothetical protein
MAYKDPSFAPIAHGSPIPNSNSTVIRSRVENVRRRLVSKAYSIHVVFMVSHAENRLPCFKVIYNDGTIASAGDNLTAISREPDRPNL